MDDAKLAGFIMAVIAESPTCMLCISTKVNATKMDALRAIQRMVGTVRMEMHTAERCRVCGSMLGPVYLAARP